MFFVSTSNITKLFDKSNSYSFEYQKNSYFILGCTAVVQEGNIRKTMAARGLVNGRDPRSGRDLVSESAVLLLLVCLELECFFYHVDRVKQLPSEELNQLGCLHSTADHCHAFLVRSTSDMSV